MALLDDLHKMLSKVLSDDEIVAGVQLTTSGLQKVCRHLHVTEKEAELLIASLRTHLSESRFDLTEDDDPRYSYEQDFLNGVTVRDAETDQSVYLTGTEAAKLLSKIEAGANEQSLLASCFAIKEASFGRVQRASAGCLVLALDTNRILFAHRSHLPPPYHVDNPDCWGTWGGAIDPGEKAADAIIRELGEEAQYHGEIEALIPLYKFVKPGYASYSNFLAVVPHEFKPHLNWENQGSRWCDFGDWPSPLHPGLKMLLGDATSMSAIKKVIADNPIKQKDNDLSEDFAMEKPSGGTFNFPWSIDGKSGFATARFAGRGPEMKVNVVYASDEKGQPFDFKAIRSQLDRAAVDFIGKE